MKTKTLKIWYGICGILACLGILYYIIRFFDNIFSDRSIEGTFLEKLNIVAIILLVIALLMLIFAIPLSKLIENKTKKVEDKKASDLALLEKYKSKKNR